MRRGVKVLCLDLDGPTWSRRRVEDDDSSALLVPVGILTPEDGTGTMNASVEDGRTRCSAAAVRNDVALLLLLRPADDLLVAPAPCSHCGRVLSHMVVESVPFRSSRFARLEKKRK